MSLGSSRAFLVRSSPIAGFDINPGSCLRFSGCIKIDDRKPSQIRFHQESGNETEIVIEVAKRVLDAPQIAEPLSSIDGLNERISLQEGSKSTILVIALLPA